MSDWAPPSGSPLPAPGSVPADVYYDGSPDALTAIEHIVKGSEYMRMTDRWVPVTQTNFALGVEQTAVIPRPDPATLEVDLDGTWVPLPLGSWLRFDNAGWYVDPRVSQESP